MLVKDDDSLSTPEMTQFQQKIECKNRETILLQQQIAQKNLEIMDLQGKLDRKNKSFLFRIKQKINSVLRRSALSHSSSALLDEQQNVVQYPKIVFIKASQLFDSNWYLNEYPEVSISGLEPAQHYLQIGAKNNYDPSPDFSTRDYYILYPDVFPMNPLLHYEIFGKAEGRNYQIEDEKDRKQNILENKIKIIFISGDPDTPGHFYRVSRYAKAANVFGVDTIELNMKCIGENLKEILNSNLVYIWRATWNEQLLLLYSTAKKNNIPIIFDIDDLLIDPKLAKINIVDGIRTTGSSEQSAVQFFESLQISMEKADYCSAPTHFLANYMKSLGKKTFYLPNGFDEHVWQASRLALRSRQTNKHDGLIRIGYAGGSRTHQKDFAKVVQVIARILEERPNCRLVLFRKDKVACTDINEFPELLALQQQVEWRELVPLKELPWEMARFDINLAPLEVGNPFCEAKSELKFFESALVEVPVVASPTQTFQQAIENGKTGFLATDESDWYYILSSLLDNASLRKEIGRNAYFSVLWKYGLEQRMELLLSMMDMIFYSGSRAARAMELNLLKSKKITYQMPIIPDHDIILKYEKLNIAEVTVLVPFCNSHYLIERLESIRAQTLLNIDLIMIDDCSLDNASEIATDWINDHKDRFNRILLIKNKMKSGMGLTKNAGFVNVETLFVLSLNRNVRLHANFTTTCLSKIKESAAAFVYANLKNIENNKILNHSYDPILISNENFVGGTALIRLSAWAKVSGYQQFDHGAEDYGFWCKFVENGLFGYHIDETLASYQPQDEPVNQSKIKATIHQHHSWILPNLLKGKIK